MSTDQFISLLATIALLELMVTVGLGVTIAEITGVVRDWRLVAQAVLANYILVPAAAVGLLVLFDAQPLVAAGFLVAAVCPGAPYGPPFTSMARGNVVMAVGLMVILAGSSAIVAPLLLQGLLPAVAGDEPIQVNVTKMVAALLLTQFLPLCIGLWVRRQHPALAQALKKPAARVSVALNLLLVGTILVAQYQMLAAVRLTGYLGMLALLGASLVAGWCLGGPGAGSRKAMTMATSVRNVGVALVIATASFPGTAAVTATTAYAIVQTAAMALLALAWGRLAPPVPPHAEMSP